jgi:predicted helicase
LSSLETIEVRPDAKQVWLNQTENDFDSLLPIASRKTKAAKTKGQERAIFKIISLGIATNRDQWAYGETAECLESKIKLFCKILNSEAANTKHTKHRTFSQFDKSPHTAKLQTNGLNEFVRAVQKWMNF